MDKDANKRTDIILTKFIIPGPPRCVAERVHRNLNNLAPLVPHRIIAAVFRTIWNMWCTSRRFQQSTSFGDVSDPALAHLRMSTVITVDWGVVYVPKIVLSITPDVKML